VRTRSCRTPTARILVYCQFGKISTLAAQTLRVLGFTRAVALDGGFEGWTQNGYPTEGEAPDRSAPA
jgi:rhodanese-related sulfurtransferase